IPGEQRTAVGLIGNDGQVDSARLQGLEGVLEVIPVTHPYKQVSREWREENTVISLENGTTIGGDEIVIMAGPCAVEGEAQILGIAHELREMGATVLRGGAFKPRSSPYSFQGLGLEGLHFLAKAREETGLAIVTEALDPDGADLVAEYADIIQIGARNMQNYPLLRRAGQTGKPILLKRGLSATIDELLLAAEYILAEGNDDVILCERGIRSFDQHTRNLLDLAAIPVVKALSHLPIIADPSHGTGLRAKVTPMGRAAIAAGADGLIVEVHPDPPHAMSDGAQSLYPAQFGEMMEQIRVIAKAIGRDVTRPLSGVVAR
ncbi:MAG: 3-deoxy-7-phosphoheptulonate synthase, partial [Gemmatimonadota bacterium]|nr:3-deoxy-7-phosphoheptulonate synthase [Gemmatimonadota bacterium]